MDKLRAKVKKILSENKGYSDYIEGGKTKGLTHDELVTILTNAAKGIKPGANKSEPKKQLKEEESLPQPAMQPGAADPVDAITIDVPLFLLLLEYAREKSKDDVDLHELTETANKLGKERGILTSNDYEAIVGEKAGEGDDEEKEDISEGFRAKLRESITKSLFENTLKEAKKGKGEELESKVSVEDTKPEEGEDEGAAEAPAEGGESPEGEAPTAEPQNPKVTMANQGDGKVNPQIKTIQDAFTQAQVAAQSLGDEKLLNQIGNTITFFTREYIVGANQRH